MIETSIIIPIHNDWLCVKDCIEAIIENTNSYEIIFLIDNSIQFQEELRKYGRVIYNAGSFNFARYINTGIKVARGQYICILNDDTVPGKEWLNKMIITNKHMGPGLVSARCQKQGCHNPDAQGEGEEQYTDYTINMFATFIPRRVINVIGYLDERFITYGGEDDDYTLRAKRCGFKSAISDGYVYHKKSQAFKSDRIKKELPKTREIFFNKWGEFMPIDLENWKNQKYAKLCMPLISILMPTRNHEKYIIDAIESILSQDYENFELLIGIDGSDQKETIKVLKQIQDSRLIILENEKQIGSCNMRNKLFERSKGEFIALMDSDDIMLPNRLKDELNAMDPDIDIIYSAYIEENNEKSRRLIRTELIDKRMLLNLKVCIAGGTFFMRRYVLEKERFKERYARAFDFEYTLRNLDKFKFKFLDKPTIVYRRHSGEHLSGNKKSIEEHNGLIRTYTYTHGREKIK